MKSLAVHHVVSAFCLVFVFIFSHQCLADQPIVRIHVKDFSNTVRTNWPVTGGVPFPKGLVNDSTLLGLQSIPSQVRVLSRWSDDSIKWALFDYQVSIPAMGRAIQTVVLKESPEMINGNVVTEDQNFITVDTGRLKFTVSKQQFSFIHQAWLDQNLDGDYEDEGEEIIKPNSGQQQFFSLQENSPTRPTYTYRARNLKTGESHSVAHSTPTVSTGPVWMRPEGGGTETDYFPVDEYQATIKESGPLRTVIEIKGRFQSTTANAWEGNTYSIWIHAYYGKSQLRAQHNILFKGDPANDYLSRMGLQLPLDFQSLPTFRAAGHSQSQQLKATDTAYLFNSGPEDVFHLYHQGFYLPWEVQDGTHVTQGTEKTQGWIDVSNSTFGVSLTIRDMAYMFPKELSYDANSKKLTAWIWPDHGGLVLDNNVTGWRTPQGKQGMQGVSVTHDILYNFHSPLDDSSSPDDLAAQFNTPLQPYADKLWYSFRGTKAAGMIKEFDVDQFPGTEAFLGTGNALLMRSMTEFGWLGMLNYGDIMQDFSYNESGTLGTWGLSDRNDDYTGWRHGNTMLSYRMIMQYLRTGEYAYWQAADSHLKHVRDVLIKHYNAFRDQLPDEIQWTGMGRRHSAYWGASTSIDQHGGVAMDGYGTNWLGHFLHWNLTGDWRTYDVLQEIRSAWNEFGNNQWVAQLSGASFVGLKLLAGIPGMEAAEAEADLYKTQAVRRARDGSDEWRDCTWFFGYNLYLQDYPVDSEIKQALYDYWVTDPQADQWGLFWHRESLAAVYWAMDDNQPVRNAIYTRLISEATESNPVNEPMATRQRNLFQADGLSGLFNSDIDTLVAAVNNHQYWRIKDDIIQLQWDEPLSMAVMDHYQYGMELIRPGDVDNSGMISLADTISCLQIIGGISPAGEVNLNSDVDSSGTIGMAECLYSLQVTAGILWE